MWENTGAQRPHFAIEPGPGQESVWDYPRPPAVEPDERQVIVRVGEATIADTRDAVRVLETASPPTFYIPPHDIDQSLIIPAAGASYCEWKGEASYWSVELPDRVIEKVAWSYETPLVDFYALAGYLSFYPAYLECTVDGVPVKPQPGGFYGGWVTPEIVGPYKGEPGTGGW